MTDEIAYQHGQIVERSQLAISVDDPGYVLGTTVSERLRTFQGQIFRWADHYQRLQRSLAILGLHFDESESRVEDLCRRIVSDNWSRLPADHDLGVVLLGAPRRRQVDLADLRIYSYPLPFEQWVGLYSDGQRLVTSRIAQVPAACWPLELKCRSRMHYYLADREAQRQDPTARAVLLDLADNVTEASTANIVAYYHGEGLVSPPLERILPGISLSTLRDLAGQLELNFHHRDLAVSDLYAADELMLCSTSPCVFPVCTLDGSLIHRGTPGPVYQGLIDAWSQLVGTDIVLQAQRIAARNSSSDSREPRSGGSM